MFREKCPLCGNERPEKSLFVRDFTGMKDIVPFVKYDVVDCPRCGMIYASSIEESMPIGEYYDLLSKYTSGTYAFWGTINDYHRRLTQYISRYVSKDTPILDIGCADGSLLYSLKMAGYKNLNGLEISSDNVSYAQNKYQLDVHVGALGGDTSALDNKRYGLIIMAGVLEHVLPLVDTLEFCKQHLRNDGMIFLGVPDVGQFPKENSLYQEFSVEHINFFSKYSLANLMGIHDFRPVDIRRDMWPFELSAIYQLTTQKQSYTRDVNGLSDMKLYLKRCEILLDRLRDRIEKVSSPYYVWGAGTHTAMLYQAGILQPEKVLGIIDSNRNFQGHYIYGCEIKNAQDIASAYPIIISSKDAQQSIVSYAKDKLHIINELVTLY